MNQSQHEIDALIKEQHQLEKSGKLHWFHWLIVGGSILLTIVAWSFVNNQVNQNVENQFRRQAAQVIQLIKERLVKYEDALWGGVATLHSRNYQINSRDWARYAGTLGIENRYPGINGIGIIDYVPASKLSTYLARERLLRPDYKIHPPHNEEIYLPITHIEPVAQNARAVGLDMAHETNRYTATIKARNTGAAQITGPITLVQDAEKTPGFLFFAPFYRAGLNSTPREREDNFRGVVYAPFIFKKLMAGTLDQKNRSVGIQIFDGEDQLYNEHIADSKYRDPNPLFRKTQNINVYGRTWKFDIWSTKQFREQNATSQPLVILFAGLFIDSLLLALFLLLARSNRQAVRFANELTQNYKIKTEALELANAELEEFAYRTSHDLRSPIISSIGILDIIKKAISNDNSKKALSSIALAHKSLSTLKSLIEDILRLTKTKGVKEEDVDIELSVIIENVLENISHMPGFEAVQIQKTLEFPGKFSSKRSRIELILFNLISNAIKYRDPSRPDQFVQISTRKEEGKFILEVRDNGLGIPQNMQGQLFQMFKRFHPKIGYGSGLGLYMIKKSADVLGGEISHRDDSQVTVFTLTLHV